MLHKISLVPIIILAVRFRVKNSIDFDIIRIGLKRLLGPNPSPNPNENLNLRCALNNNSDSEKISIWHEFDFFRKVNLFLTSWETNCQKLFFDPEPKMDMTWPGQADPDGVATPDPLKKKQFIISNWLIINKFCLKRITIHELLWWLWFEVTFLRFWKRKKS